MDDTSIFNLKIIQNRLAAEEIEYNEMDDIKFRRLYLGSVLDLMPSGKCYVPWSASVTVEEREMDAEWLKQAEAELQQINAFLESGECDGCDLFIIQVVD